jgi:hypothetical protein
MRFAHLITAGLLALCTTVLAQNVTFDYDRQTDFSKFRTYSWVKGHEIPDQLNHRRIVNAVEAQLAVKGLLKTETLTAADVAVAYHASFERDLQITGFSSGWGGYYFGGSRSGSARTEEILTGTLIVDVVNTQTRQIVWRAIASKEIDVDAKPETRERNINRAVEKLFRNYPGPKPAGR